MVAVPQAQGVGSGARPLCAQVAARGLSSPAWGEGEWETDCVRRAGDGQFTT